MRWKLIVISVCAAAVGVSAVSAQTCPDAAGALAALARDCATLARGELCQHGQIVALAATDSFTVDTAALARLQANYPDPSVEQFVSAAFLGSVTIHSDTEMSAEPLPPRIPVAVHVSETRANVRSLPARSGSILTSLEDSAALTATGISADGVWIRVQLADQPAQTAWISRSLIHSDYDLTLLAVASADAFVPQYPEFTPMQAFSFASASPCDGVVVQSGENPAQLVANAVDLTLIHATAFLQNTGDALLINVFEGVVQARAHDTTISGVPGTVIQVVLNAAGQPEQPPEAPIAYEAAALTPLAGDYLPREVTIAPAASDEAIQSALTTPLGGVWEIDYPPANVCHSGEQKIGMCVTGGKQIVSINVTEDGSSFRWYDPLGGSQIATRSAVGVYLWRSIPFQVLSPVQMILTYDVMRSGVTTTWRWLGTGK